MENRIYLQLLVLCGILCQKIIATSGEDTRASSDFLVRNKRVINHLPGGHATTPLSQANHMVNIKYDERSICAGAILSHYTVITADACFSEDVHLEYYKVLSGAGYDARSKRHSITSKVVFYGNRPHQVIDGIALITVDPPFVYDRNTGPIELHVGTLPVGTLVTVRGWGYNYPLRPGLAGTQRRLRSIIVPIMNNGECRNDYQHFYTITDKHICTYHADQYCALSDVGAPLIFNNTLVGVHVWKGQRMIGRNPEVYVDLNRADYRTWIRENTLLM